MLFDEIEVALVSNPWPSRLGDVVVFMELMRAGTAGQVKMRRMVDEGKIKSDSSASCVILCPSSLSFAPPQILGIIEIGPDARGLRDNAYSKALSHQLRGIPTGEQVADFPHLMGDHEFAHGGSRMHRGMFAATSGLPVIPAEQIDRDGELTQEMLVPFVNRSADLLTTWLTMQRQGGKKHGWWNPDNKASYIFDTSGLRPIMTNRP